MKDKFLVFINYISYSVLLKIIPFLMLFCCFNSTLLAQTTKTSTGSTDWNSAGTWSPSGVPGLLDPVIIRPGDVVTVNSTPSNAAASVTFNNTAATDSGLLIASGATLTITGGVTLLNSDSLFTNASISGLGTLLCQTLTIGSTTIVNAKNSDPTINTLTLTISNLTVSGNIVLINSDEGGKDASKPNLIISSPCNLSANSIIYTHVGPSNGPDSENFFNLNSGATLNLTAAIPFVIDSNKSLKDYMVDINLNTGSNLNLCGTTSLPATLSNSGSGGTTSPVPLNTSNTNLSFSSSINLTSGAGTNVVSTPVNVAMINITYSTGGTTGATFSGLPSGVTGSWSGGVVTISGIPTSLGVYNYTINTIGAGLCGAKTATGTITTYVCPTFSLLSTTTSSVNVCVGSSSLISLTANAANLPVGNYTVSYNIQGVDQPDAAMTITTAGIGSFVYTGFTTAGDRTVTITKITSGLCSSVITTNNFDSITIVAVLSAPTALAGSGATCTQITSNWTALSGATYYELDVSTSSTFSSFVSGYTALNVGLVTSYNITGLTSGVPYYYRVRAFNGVCISSSSSTITYATLTVPNVPSGLTQVYRCDELTARWTAGSGATSYEIQWSTSASDFATILGTATGITTLSYSITGLPNGSYKYRVRSINNCSSSNYVPSGTVSESTSVPPRPGSNVAGGSATCDQFTVTWQSVTGAASYKLEWSIFNTFPPASTFFQSDITALTYTITGLSGSTPYFYRLSAENNCGVSAVRNGIPASVTTLPSNPEVPTGVSVDIPTILCTQFTMSWTAPVSGGVSSYTVERASTNTFTTGLVTVTGITNTSYTFTGLNSGTNYYYRVRAVSCNSSANVNGSPAFITTLSSLPSTPTISSTGALTFCENDSVTLGATAGGTSYDWFLNGSLISTETTGFLFVTTAGSYTVRLTNASGCQSASSAAAVVVVQGLPTASAGGSQSICTNTTANVNGATANNGIIAWTENGAGSITSGATTLTPVYTPALADAGNTVTLTMTVTSNNTCAPQTATAIYTVTVNAVPTAGLTSNDADNTFCEGTSVTFTATGGTNYNFRVDGNSVQNSITDIYTTSTLSNGQVVDVIVTNSLGCTKTSTGITNTVNALPTAGLTSSDADTIFCAGTSVTFTATGGANYNFRVGGSSVQNSTTATYTTNSLTNGQVVDVIVTNSSGCTRTSTGITNTVNALPTILTQPINQLECEGGTRIVTFNVVASGTGLTYVWQRKLPADAGFITIPVETNVTYPSAGEIRIQNVGSSLSSDGTQYQVIISNATCSVTSSVATLSVNEILGISPISTSVTQCYGTNYSYTVSTSYPANVVSYQWKSSVTSGIWDDVVDGTHFSGAKTATLNIINGTPAESAEYRVYIKFTSSGTDCNVNSTSRNRMITFLPLLTTPVTTVTQPTCSTATGTISATVQSASDTYSFDNGVTYQASNIKSGLASGNYNVIIKNSQNCISPTTIATIDPQPTTPAQPILSLAALPTCTSLGSFTITNYNGSHTYTVSPTTGVSISGNTVTAPAGNYTVIATLGLCPSLTSSNLTITPLVTKTWNGISWSPNLPTSDDLVIIDSNYNTTSINPILNACSLVINSGSKLTVEPLTSVNIQNDLTVNGTLDVLDQGSLIMINDAGIVTNNGTTKIHRFTSLFEKFDYVYWSTPVESTFIPSTFLNWRTNYAFEFLPANFADLNGDSFDDDSNDWSYASTMSPGKGYIVMTPTNKAMYPNVEEIVYSGKVNNGIITAPIALTPSAVDADDDFNLVGNPYPSAIDADAFINANISTNVAPYNTIGGTLYFWTHIGDISNTNGGPDGLNFSTNDYAVYTLAGGVGTSGNFVKVNGVDLEQVSNKPTGFIASGQGFFVEADNAGSILFNNAMRVGTEIKNNQFYKVQSNKNKVATVSKNRLWLNLENDSKMFSQQLIGYFDNATLGYDRGYDGLFSDAGNFINFYSFINNDTYKIQGRSSFDENDQVRLGYSSTVAGTFTIAIDSKEGVFTNTNQAVYLEDKVTNTIFDLKSGAYSFTTEKGTFNDRFILRYTDRTLGVNEVNKEDGILVFYSKNNKMLTIKNERNNSTIRSIALYTISGQNVLNWKVENQGQNTIQIPVKNNSTGIYIVKVKTSEGEISKKISID